MNDAQDRHGCSLEGYPRFWRAAAVTDSYEDKEGYLIVSNGEYSNAVNYCPQCGYKAKLSAESYAMKMREEYRLEQEEETRKAKEKYQKAKARKLERRDKDKA